MINLPTHILDERIVAAFPIIGDTTFVEADVVTEHRHEDGSTPSFTVRRLRANGEVLYSTAAGEYTSFPAAIRQARKNAGWG